MVWSKLEVRLGNEGEKGSNGPCRLTVKSQPMRLPEIRESMRCGGWPKGQLDRTQLNTNPTRARTTIASAEANECLVGDGENCEYALTNGDYLAGQCPELQSRRGLYALVPR